MKRPAAALSVRTRRDHKASAGALDDDPHMAPAHAQAAVGPKHVQAAHAADRRMRGEWIDIHTADADVRPTAPRREKRLAGLVEPA
jgi:hypothetical protein